MSTLSTIKDVVLLVGGIKPVVMVFRRVCQFSQFALAADADGTPHWQQPGEQVDCKGVRIVRIGLEEGCGERHFHQKRLFEGEERREWEGGGVFIRLRGGGTAEGTRSGNGDGVRIRSALRPCGREKGVLWRRTNGIGGLKEATDAAPETRNVAAGSTVRAVNLSEPPKTGSCANELIHG